jgi:predicted nuclease of predicted toxin-antitoxin system
VRLYADENFPRPVVDELRRLGHDVLTLQEAGHGNQSLSDEAVLAMAFSEKRIFITLNRKHFIRLDNDGRNHCGVIVCTVDLDFTGLVRRIHEQISVESRSERFLIRMNRPTR